MKRFWLLLLTAIIEMMTGLLLLVLPPLPLDLLLGLKQVQPELLWVARLAGAAILAIGIMCCLARTDSQSPAQRSILLGMLFYNLAAASLLAYAGIGLSLTGIVLWPAVILHIILALWCMVCCLGSRRN